MPIMISEYLLSERHSPLVTGLTAQILSTTTNAWHECAPRLTPMRREPAPSTEHLRMCCRRGIAGPGAEAPGSVARRAHAPEDYAARRISMPTLSLAFRVLVRCSKQGLPAPNRSSPYRKSHLTLPKQDRTRDPFTVQSNLFRPQQKHPGSALSATPDARPDPRSVSGAGCFWWRRRVPPPGPETLL